MIKRGTVRADKKIFWAYKISKAKKYETWLSKEKFAHYENNRKKYSSTKLKKYREEQAKLDPEDRNSLGKYNPENGLYYIRMNSNGKPRYGTLEQVEKFRLTRKTYQKKRYEKFLKTIPLPNVCLGDKHPTDPNLIVIEIRNNRIKYGAPEVLEKRRARIKLCGELYRKQKGKEIVQKAREIRYAKMQYLRENPSLRFRRGDTNPLTGWKFWGYSSLGNEVWLHPEEFAVRRDIFNRKRLEHYYKKKLNK